MTCPGAKSNDGLIHRYIPGTMSSIKAVTHSTSGDWIVPMRNESDVSDIE
jgi:hypothetical protein